LELHGHKVIEQWVEMTQKREWNLLVSDLLSRHYDPAYQRSTANNFPQLKDAQRLQLAALDVASLSLAARTLIR
jgi:tRNA 2-selenouridine synthase